VGIDRLFLLIVELRDEHMLQQVFGTGSPVGVEEETRPDEVDGFGGCRREDVPDELIGHYGQGLCEGMKRMRWRGV